MKNKCFKCRRRKIGCHGKCKHYKKYKNNLEEIKKRKQKLKPVILKHDRRCERELKK
jgi:hypothetical protein